MNTGTIKQIVGPVVDVYFEHNIPEVEMRSERLR
ncbi:MAG: hypothetical protein UW54_C0021G0010 [Parcubacteria group bacterium GW2011_GWC1_44_26]|nr:MAG: hypothetical protein UW54_C0021G0010 [Parcubacteria group bacterium GW2011_GWC1_44_26]